MLPCRTLLAAGVALAAGARAARAASLQPMEMQLGWIGGGNQLGEVVVGQFEKTRDRI